MLGPPHHCWAYLAWVSGRETLYLGSSIIIINYLALSAGIGGAGWDGWQHGTLDDTSFLGMPSKLIHLDVGLPSLLVFSGVKYI